MTPRRLTGLLVPADPGRSLALCTVADSTVAISDLMGGVLLDDPVVRRLGEDASMVVYRPEDSAHLPANRRLSLVARQVGIVDRAFHDAARGDALILGILADRGVDVDVPTAVVAAVRRIGRAVLDSRRDPDTGPQASQP